MGRRLQLIWGMLLLVILLTPTQAFGHTALVEMAPKAGSQLEQSPKYIQLLFSEKLEAVSEESLFVVDSTGKSIEAGIPEVGNKGKSILVTLPELVKGTYIVRYHVMSLDGHMVEGEYDFTVLTDQGQVMYPVPAEPEVHPDHPDKQAELEAPTQVTVDYGTAPIEDDLNTRVRWTDVFTEISVTDVLRMIYFIILLVLVGMMIWYIMLWRDRSDEHAYRHRNWIVQLQRIHILVLIVVVAEFIQHTVGFEDWQLVKKILLQTTTGTSWSVLFVFSMIGLGVLQRNRIVDLLWILAVVATLTQIGHVASSEYRMIASVLSAIHVLAAAIWGGGLLYLVLLWGRYRHIAEKLILKLSNASLIAITLLALSGIVSSILYLRDISYIFETRWGHLLLIKVAVVVIVIIIAAIIRRRYIRKGQLRVGAWIKLDFVMLLVIASLAALLTSVEPNPPNEPLHWHVMWETIHMTAEITPNIPGDNRFAVRVWLPEDSGEPNNVSLVVTHESDEDKQNVVLTKVNGSNDYGFGGFNEFIYQADSNQLDQAGIWSIDIEVTNQQGQSWTYKKQMRVY